MKKKITRLYGTFWAVLAGYIFLSFSSNPPNGSQGYTGAPTNFATCASSNGGCHSGGGGTGNVMITGLPATIMPSTVYPITVSVNRTNNTPEEAGFQMTVLDGNNNFVGTFSNPGPNSTTQSVGGRTLHEHSPAQSFGGNTVSYTIDWTSPATGSGNITMYAAGNLANGNGATSGDNIVTTTAVGMFQGGGGVISVNVTGTNVDCFGQSTGTVTATPSGGGGPPYFYAWSNGGNTQALNNLPAGMYTVTVTNGSGGQGTGSVTITQPSSAVSVSIINQTNITCANPNGTATAQGSGGTPGWTYAWSNGNNGPTASFPAAGNYTVTVTDANQCMSTTSVTITADNVPPAVEAGPSATIDCTNPTATLNGTGSAAGPGITYLWTTTNGQIISGANTLFPQVGMAGTYTLTVTNNNNGCTAEDNTTVTGNAVVPISDAGDDMELSCNVPMLLLDGSNSSGGANFTYLWTTTGGNILSGATTLFPEVNTAGTYTLTVTNTDNGCNAQDDVVVTSNTAMPTSNAGQDMTLTCANTTVELDGSASSSGNFSYLWSTSDGNIVSGGTTTTPIVDSQGTYCLTVTDLSNGCTATDCTSVDEDTTEPIADAGSASPLTCTTTSVTLDGSASASGANITYQWSTTNGSIVSGATTTTPTVNQTGTYIIEVTNTVNGCSSTDEVTVTENTTPPTADAGPSMALNCNNTTVVLNGSGSSQGGNFEYTWSGPGIQSGGTSANPTVNAAGAYSITVTNTNTGCTAESSTEVTQTPALNAEITGQENVLCSGESTGVATAEATGGNGTYSFAWSNGGTTAVIENLQAGMYTVTVTDDDNCTSTATVTITEPDELLANASATPESFAGANDGTATTEPEGGTGAYSYLWSNGETTQTITGLMTGNYTVTVTDGNLCTAVETVTVASFNCAAFAVGFSSIDPDCNGAATGSATAEPTGGTEPYSYSWSNGSMDATANNLEAGTYTVTVFDANDCEVTGNVTLSEPPALGLMTTQTSNVLCNGAATGAASLSANGGTPGYSYLWPDGNTNPDRDDLAADTYVVTVTDANDCTATTSFTISEPQALTANISSTDETSVGAADGTATAPPTGGTAPFTFLWSNGDNTQSINNLMAGEYCVTVTDANNCQFEGCTTVNAFGCAGAATTTSGTNVSCFGESDGTASVDASGFTEPISYIWSNGGAGANIGMLPADMYSVTVTDANNCSAIDMIEITQPDTLTVDVVDIQNLECPDDMSGAIAVMGDGGTPDYSYSWSNGAFVPNIAGLDSGSFEVTVSDDNNCEASLFIEVGVDPDTVFPNAVTQNITIALDVNGMASITASQIDGGSTDNCGVAALVIDISDFTCADLGENEVVLAVADAANNCSAATAIVTIVDEIAPTILCPPNITVSNGSCQAVVEYAEPIGEDNCGNVTVNLEEGLPSGSTFPSGTTIVAWTAEDGSGNTAACSFNVAVENDFSAETTFTQPSCNGDSDGTATANPSNGTEPYTYAWDDPNGQTTQTAIGLSANMYTVTVTDSDGCSTVTTVEINEPPALDVTVNEVTNETGTNMDGAIDVTVLFGQGAITYEWSLNGSVVSTDEDPTGLSAGEYTLVATDANGCTIETTVTVDMVSSAFDSELEGRISLFPNPAAESVNIRFELPQTMGVQLSMLDLTGRSVLPERRENLSERTLNLDVGELPAGIYHLRMVVDESVVVKRVVIQ